MRNLLLSAILLHALVPVPALADGNAPLAATASLTSYGIPGIRDEMFAPAFWIWRLTDADAVVMEPAEIAAQNARLLATDPSMHRLADVGAEIEGAQVRAWIEKLSKLPTDPLFDVEAKPVPPATLSGLLEALALEAIPASQPARFGLVVKRASLRAFPTSLRVFNDHLDGPGGSHLRPSRTGTRKQQAQHQHTETAKSHDFLLLEKWKAWRSEVFESGTPRPAVARDGQWPPRRHVYEINCRDFVTRGRSFVTAFWPSVTLIQFLE